MSEDRPGAALKRAVAARARGRCEYCLTPQSFSASPFTIDHITPSSRGGESRPENLAFACAGCNGRKYAIVDAVDPATGSIVRLFHPRHDDWNAHFVWDESFTRILGRTPIGRATIDVLALNRPELLNLRRALRAVSRHP